MEVLPREAPTTRSTFIEVDRLLERMLRDVLPAEVQISFAAPTTAFAQAVRGVDTVNIFFADVRENSEMRDRSQRIEKEVDTTTGTQRAIVRKPPILVDCTYVITAWCDDPLEEHRLMEEVLTLLASTPRLRLPRHPNVRVERPEDRVPTNTAQGGALRDPMIFWQTMGVPYRLFFTFRVSVPIEQLDAQREVRLVRQRDIRVSYEEDWPEDERS